MEKENWYKINIMGCGCGKINKDYSLEKLRKLAVMASKEEMSDYVIYKYEDKIYFEKKTCWEKDGRKGEVRELICYT